MASDAPWLDWMIADIGVHRNKTHDEPHILECFADCGHSEIKSDEVSWCAAFMGAALVHSGLPIPPKDTCLMARSYCTYGVRCEPKPGAIVGFPRGNSGWQGHVGVVTEIKPGNRIKYLAG